MTMERRNDNDACAGCALSQSRRDFVATSSAMLAGLVALGMPSALAALPHEFARGERTADGQLSYPVPSQDGVTIDRDNEVIIVRWQSAVYAFALSCPHQRTMLRWMEREKRFQCPKHKSRYQPDGRFISGKATRGMDRHPVTRTGSSLLVDASRKLLQDDNEAAWAAAHVTLS